MEKIDLDLKLGIGFCITLLILPNYKEIKSVKANFKLTTQATLKLGKTVIVKGTVIQLKKH